MTDDSVAVGVYRGSPELATLMTIAGVALIVGFVVLGAGIVDASPGWDDAWDEQARRAAQVAWGAAIAALGLVAGIGALVLAGVRRELARRGD